MIIRTMNHSLAIEIIRKRKLNEKDCQIITDFLGLPRVFSRLEKELNCGKNSKIEGGKKVIIHFKNGVRLCNVETVYELLEKIETGMIDILEMEDEE